VILLFLLLAALAEAAEVREEHILFRASDPEWIRATAPALLRTRQRLAFEYGAVNDSGLTVLITGNRDEFLQAVGGHFPDWGVAAARPRQMQIILQAPGTRFYAEPYVEVVGHEYGHIFLHLLAGGSARIPRWLDEGFAMRAGFEWTLATYARLAKASVTNSLLPLADLEHVNTFGGEKAALAYTESLAAFDYLQESYGRESVRELVRALGDGMSVEAAFRSVLGIGYREFGAQFTADVRRRYNLFSLFVDSGLIWVLLALLVVVGWLVSKRRAREVHRRWRIEDRIHGEPDFNEYVDPNDDDSWRGGGGPQV